MKSFLCTVAVLAISAAAPAMAQNTAAGTKTTVSGSASQEQEAGSPQVFVNKAAVSNMFEIESSKLALEKTDSKDVRDFAQRLIDDHTKAGSELKQAAAAEDIADVPSSLDDKHQQMLDKLKNAGGTEFTTLYLDMQVPAHENAIALFKSFKDHSGKLGQFAAKTLPTLQEHLEMAQKLQKSS